MRTAATKFTRRGLRLGLRGTCVTRYRWLLVHFNHFEAGQRDRIRCEIKQRQTAATTSRDSAKVLL